MPTDEQVRLTLLQLPLRAGIVVARIAALVCHVNAHAFTRPLQVAGQLRANFGAVDVAENATHRPELLQPVKHFHRAEVAGVPQFCAFLKVVEYRFIEEAMGVGNEANLHEYDCAQRSWSLARPPRSTKPTASFPSWHAYS